MNVRPKRNHQLEAKTTGEGRFGTLKMPMTGIYR
jgi:hypothetical protein